MAIADDFKSEYTSKFNGVQNKRGCAYPAAYCPQLSEYRKKDCSTCIWRENKKPTVKHKAEKATQPRLIEI